MAMEYSGRGDPIRSLELLWGTKERPSRGPKPGLSVERIVHAAIEIADAEGLAALSMQRVAKRLGFTAMSLYRYVPSKAELLDVMLDRVHGEEARADSIDGGWRASLELLAREDWAMYHRHPWVLQVAMCRPPLGPNVIGVYESALHAVAGIGLSESEMNAVVKMVTDYVHGAARIAVTAAQVEQQSGVSDDQWWEARAGFWEDIFDTSRYPTMTRLYEAGVYDEQHNSAAFAQATFEFGLQRILDGIEAFMQARSEPPGSP